AVALAVVVVRLAAGLTAAVSPEGALAGRATAASCRGGVSASVRSRDRSRAVVGDTPAGAVGAGWVRGPGAPGRAAASFRGAALPVLATFVVDEAVALRPARRAANGAAEAVAVSDCSSPVALAAKIGAASAASPPGPGTAGTRVTATVVPSGKSAAG